jgi:hypothetical protein
MVCESAGAIVDRTRENLGSSDRAVVAMRRTLIDAAVACGDRGVRPEGSLMPHLYRVRATQTVLPEGADPEDSDALMATARPSQTVNPQGDKQ